MTAPDDRPLSADHVEIFSSTNVYSVDHEALPIGPARNPRTLHRPSPYRSPDVKSRRTLFRRPNSTWDSCSDIGSDSDTDLSSNLGQESPSRPIGHVRAYHSDASSVSDTSLRRTKSRVYAYDSDTSNGCDDQGMRKDASGSKKHAPADKEQTSLPVQIPAADELDSASNSDHIEKPPGEVGRPGRGGYTLRASVTWTDRTYARVKQFIDALVEEKLDCKLSFSNQSLRNLQDVKNRATAKFSFLNRYRNLWVVEDLIRMHLKVRKAALKKLELERIAANAKGQKAGEEHATNNR